MARPKTPVEREWESPRESAEATGTSVPMIYAALGRGDIEARKMGTRTLIRVASRRAYFDNLPPAKINMTTANPVR